MDGNTHNTQFPDSTASPTKKVKSTTKDFSISEVKMATNLGKDIFFHRNTCMSESFLSNTSVYLLYLQLAKSKQCKTDSGTVWDLWTYSQLFSSLLCFYRKWMKISVPRFDSLPSPPTNKSFQIWFLYCRGEIDPPTSSPCWANQQSIQIHSEPFLTPKGKEWKLTQSRGRSDCGQLYSLSSFPVSSTDHVSSYTLAHQEVTYDVHVVYTDHCPCNIKSINFLSSKTSEYVVSLGTCW